MCNANALSLVAGQSVTDNSSSDGDVCVRYDNSTNTINVCNGKVSISSISSIVNNSRVLVETSVGDWFLNANIFVSQNSTLYLNSTDISVIRLNSTLGDASSIYVQGSIVIDNIRLMSWDSIENRPARITFPDPMPRSSIVLLKDSTGMMNITNSYISHLGYPSNGASGISLYSGDGSVIKNNRLPYNYRGLYLSGLSNVSVEGNTIYNSTNFGIGISNTENVEVKDNSINNTRPTVVRCKELCVSATANDPAYGTYLAKTIQNTSAPENTLTDSILGGVYVYNSANATIHGNNIANNRFGIIVSGDSDNNTITSNIINKSRTYGIQMYGNSSQNTVKNNTILHSQNSGIAVYTSETQFNKFVANKIANSTVNGVKISRAQNNEFISNEVHNSTKLDYHSEIDSRNKIIDTVFKNTSLGFVDKRGYFVIESNDNIITHSTKGILNVVQPTKATLLIPASVKNVKLETVNMTAVPTSNYVNISISKKNTAEDENIKRWFVTTPYRDISVQYTIGDLTPNTPFPILSNASEQMFDVSANSTGYVTFNPGDTLPNTEYTAVDREIPLVKILLIIMIIVGVV